MQLRHSERKEPTGTAWKRHPEVKMAITNNANSNAPMLSINRQLGFSVQRETRTYKSARML
jgi:hypothetical protein